MLTKYRADVPHVKNIIVFEVKRGGESALDQYRYCTYFQLLLKSFFEPAKKQVFLHSVEVLEADSNEF